VRLWCRQEFAGASELGRRALLQNASLLLIQVDSDILGERDLLDADEPEHTQEIRLADAPCPPPSAAAHKVRTLLMNWLGVEAPPANLLFCVPSMSTETWAFVALFPEDQVIVGCEEPDADEKCIECRRDIKMLIRKRGKNLRPKLVVSQDGQPKNQCSGYRAIAHRITRSWKHVVKICGEARRFDEELHCALSAPRSPE
jgi:hypothetical protein